MEEEAIGALKKKVTGWELVAQDLCAELVGNVIKIVEEKKDLIVSEAAALEAIRNSVNSECKEKQEIVDREIKERLTFATKQLEDIDKKRQGLEKEIEDISKTTRSWNKIVKLNVGGKYFTTSSSTLTRYDDSMLGRMFSGRHELALDDEGRVFIDRNGEVFDSVIEFLRDGAAWEPPTDELTIRRLQREFEFYQLPWPTGPSIYVIGGSHGPGSSTALQAVQKYDLISKRWSTKASLPLPRQHAPAVTLDGKIYLVGGEYGSDGSIRLASIDRYDPIKDEWLSPTVNTLSQHPSHTTVASMGLKRSAFCAVASDGVVYAIGGYDGNSSVKSVERYDPHVNSWTSCAPMISARHGFAATTMGGCLYVSGGSATLSAAERYDPRTGQWTALPNVGVGRDFLAAVALNDSVYAIGGRKDKQPQSRVDRFDVRANRWVPVASMLEARFGNSAVAVDGKIFVLGGWDGITDKVGIESYDPNSDVWVAEGAMSMGKRYFACCVLDH